MIISCYILLCYLQESVSHAAAIDSDSNALKKALMGLGELGLLGCGFPHSRGLEVSEETFTPSRASGEILWSLSIPANSTSELPCSFKVRTSL